MRGELWVYDGNVGVHEDVTEDRSGRLDCG